MRVMVTGSRDWTDYDLICDRLEAAGATAVIHGCAPGADSLAAIWATSKGLPAIGIPAPWEFYPRAIAGPKRNGWLLDLDPDMVIAFPLDGSRGTWDAIGQARNRQVPLFIVRDYLTVGGTTDADPR